MPSVSDTAYPRFKMRRRHETEFYARQASILLGNNACRSGNDRSPTLKVFFALSRGRRDTQRALNSVSCLLFIEERREKKYSMFCSAFGRRRAGSRRGKPLPPLTPSL